MFLGKWRSCVKSNVHTYRTSPGAASTWWLNMGSDAHRAHENTEIGDLGWERRKQYKEVQVKEILFQVEAGKNRKMKSKTQKYRQKRRAHFFFLRKFYVVFLKQSSLKMGAGSERGWTMEPSSRVARREGGRTPARGSRVSPSQAGTRGQVTVSLSFLLSGLLQRVVATRPPRGLGRPLGGHLGFPFPVGSALAGRPWRPLSLRTVATLTRGCGQPSPGWRP